MSDADRDMLQIADPKVVQAKINSNPREKALQAAAEVTLGQFGIQQGSISEANSEAIDLSTFKMKDITADLSLVEDVKAAMDNMELGHAARKLDRHLRRATKSLNSAWDHTQTASFANAGVRYASIVMVDVGARAVHGGLRTLWVQALRVGTCAQAHQADQLVKHAKIVPISNQSLLGKA